MLLSRVICVTAEHCLTNDTLCAQMVAAFSVSPTAMERFCVGDFALLERSASFCSCLSTEETGSEE